MLLCFRFPWFSIVSSYTIAKDHLICFTAAGSYRQIVIYSEEIYIRTRNLMKEMLYERNVRTNFHLALVDICSLDLWFSWVIKILSSSPQFVHHFQFLFTRMTSLSGKSFRFILKLVLDYARLSANSRRRARIYNKLKERETFKSVIPSILE